MTGQMLIKIEELIIQEKPDWVLIYRAPIQLWLVPWLHPNLTYLAHVEAGLRSDNRRMPEEINQFSLIMHATFFCSTRTKQWLYLKAFLKNCFSEM